MAKTTSSVSANGGGDDPRIANLRARNFVLERSVDMTQSIYSQTLTGTVPGQVINVPLRNVGLIKKLVVEITGNFTQGNAETQNRTPWGPANLLSQVVLTDLANQTRINTTGWHLHMLATARRQMAFGAAFTNDSPIAVGSNNSVITAASSVTTVSPFRMFYEVPLAYGDYDLRGSLYANVVNATMNLQLTINPNYSVASTANPTLAGYISSSSDIGVLSGVTVNVYQNYLDQIPVMNDGPVLPLMDLATAYLLNNTAITGITANQDIPVPFSNFRDFMSMGIIYDNFGSSTPIGQETNRWSLQSANYTNIFQMDPWMAWLQTRNIINDDFPSASARTSFYFDFRRKPVVTIQYGNMQMIGNFSNVSNGAVARLLVGFESLSLINQVTQAGSLAAN